MARRVNVEIKLENGKTLTHFHSVRITQALFAHNTFEIAVPFEMLEKKDENFFSQAHRDVCGKTVTVSLSPVSGSGSYDFLFKGIVTQITLHHKGSLANGFLLKGFSPTILLEDCLQRRIFQKQSLAQVVDNILSQYPANLLKRQIRPVYQGEVRYATQYDESNFGFLCRLAAQYGEWLYYDGCELRMGKPDEGKVKEFKIDGIQKFNLAVTLQPLRFQLNRYNYLRHESYNSTSDHQSVPGLNAFGQFALQESDLLFSNPSGRAANLDLQEQLELDELAKTRKATGANQLVTFEGTGENPDLLPGTIIEAFGFRPGSKDREDYGKYRITEITHEINSNGNYGQKFKAVPDKTEYPPVPAGLQPPRAYPEFAEVTDNQDPEHLGRVKVRFFWPQTDHAESDWLRVALPYTGSGAGMLFVPEEGAQVLVGYEAGLAELPLVAGSLYHQDAADPPDDGYTHTDNELKALSTKAGNRILWQDKTGDLALMLGNTKKDTSRMTLSFEGDGSITIETDGRLSLKGREIELEAQTTMTLKANSIEMTGQEKITADAPQIAVNATSSAEIVSRATLKLSGMSTELEGSASAKLSGATVDVSGQAMVKVEAALVKIN
jgi:uncharacterized protein involved in type VI secretion and phage assembly